MPPKLTPRASAPALPLTFRLPNPPALFLGRAAEAAFLREAIPRAPVTVVAGDGGLGKSALTLSVLHGAFADRVASAVFVSLRGGDPLEPLALAAARALVRAGGLSGFDWSELLGAPEALATLAIDLADAQERWVVLDDLHHADQEEVRALLQQVSRYARTSRWIATTRAAPRADELAGQVLRLGAMDAADLQRLAQALSPSSGPDEIARAVQQAEGSPWRLRQGGAAAASGPLSPADLAAGLSPATLDFLGALSLVTAPLPEALLAEAAPRPSEPLAVLEGRALVERTAEGVRLHEVTRALVPAPDRSPRWQEVRRRLGAALGASAEGTLRLEGLRVLFGAGARAEAAAVLEAGGEALLDAGYAAALWGLLEPLSPANLDAGARASLERWRLRCATQLGDAHVLGRARPPESDAPEVRLLWARLLAIKGELESAETIAGEARRDADQAGDARTAFDAAVLQARCLGNLGHLGRALAALRDLAPPDPLRAAKAEAVRTAMLVEAGEPEHALAKATALAAALPDLPWPARGEVGQQVVHALYALGRLREANDAFERTVAADQRGSARFDVGRMLRHAHCCVLADSGELERARRELDALEPYLGHGRGSLLRDYVAVIRAHTALAEGNIEEADRRCAELAARALPPRLSEEALAIGARTRVLARDGRPPGAEEVLSFEGAERPRIARVQLALRSFALAPERTLAALAPPAQEPEMRIAARTVTAEARLLAGDAEGAAADATAAITMAVELGYGVCEAEARAVLFDALLVAGRRAAMKAAAADLARRAATLGSPRFARTAALCQALAEDGDPDPAVLEALAASTPALDAGWRARTLLGAPARDALDDCVLSAFRKSGRRLPEPIGGPAPSTGSAPPGGAHERWIPGWGIDETRARVWLPDGRTVDLARHPIPWALLRCLAAHGGAATKETLTLEVWSERDYHPLRHDNRLQAAVRKLRLQIEDDPAAPSRFVTTGDGYALAGAARRLR